MQIRLSKPNEKGLKIIAARNRRTITAEANIGLELHVGENVGYTAPPKRNKPVARIGRAGH